MRKHQMSHDLHLAVAPFLFLFALHPKEYLLLIMENTNYMTTILQHIVEYYQFPLI